MTSPPHPNRESSHWRIASQCMHPRTGSKSSEPHAILFDPHSRNNCYTHCFSVPLSLSLPHVQPPRLFRCCGWSFGAALHVAHGALGPQRVDRRDGPAGRPHRRACHWRAINGPAHATGVASLGASAKRPRFHARVHPYLPFRTSRHAYFCSMPCRAGAVAVDAG